MRSCNLTPPHSRRYQIKKTTFGAKLCSTLTCLLYAAVAVNVQLISTMMHVIKFLTLTTKFCFVGLKVDLSTWIKTCLLTLLSNMINIILIWFGIISLLHRDCYKSKMTSWSQHWSNERRYVNSGQCLLDCCCRKSFSSRSGTSKRCALYCAADVHPHNATHSHF